MENSTLFLITWWVIFVIIIAWIYNKVISAKNNANESKSAIDTVFQNRYDLIPNLIEVVKQYASHEKDVLIQVTQARSNAMSWQEMTKEKLQNENTLSWTMKSIFALSENYPDLKANQNFINLQNQWSEIEDRLQAARRAYNAAVKELDNVKQQFPSNIIAWMMTIEKYEMYEADENARKSLDAKKLFS